MKAGDRYIHHSGRAYEIIHVGNEGFESEKFPLIVSYKNVIGDIFSRGMSEFLEKFRRVEDGVE